NRSRGFSFTTKGYTGNQNIILSMDYFGDYRLVSGNDRPFLCNMYGTPLQVARTFAPIPEPATVLLFGSGLLSWLFLVRPQTSKRTRA
ncbi:PEP-CTERM sorting domain-containing protein, partial [Candidatus Bathyarchaeota archaeon]|nr:PEP-CTERM sorting domain-containing protein [Candidatus Bathyarchaeota archaeon]